MQSYQKASLVTQCVSSSLFSLQEERKDLHPNASKDGTSMPRLQLTSQENPELHFAAQRSTAPSPQVPGSGMSAEGLTDPGSLGVHMYKGRGSKSVPHRLQHLNIRPPLGGTIYEV